VHVLSAKYRVQHENEAANLLLGERNACFAEKSRILNIRNVFCNN